MSFFKAIVGVRSGQPSPGSGGVGKAASPKGAPPLTDEQMRANVPLLNTWLEEVIRLHGDEPDGHDDAFEAMSAANEAKSAEVTVSYQGVLPSLQGLTVRHGKPLSRQYFARKLECKAAIRHAEGDLADAVRALNTAEKDDAARAQADQFESSRRSGGKSNSALSKTASAILDKRDELQRARSDVELAENEIIQLESLLASGLI